MGRAINKTVTIVELIKVSLADDFSWFSLTVCSLLLMVVWIYCIFLNSEENCWSSPNYINSVHWYHWHMGTSGGRPPNVSLLQMFYVVGVQNIISYPYIITVKHTYITGLIDTVYWSYSLETTRKVSMVTITLSKKDLDLNNVGWVASIRFCWLDLYVDLYFEVLSNF